MQTLSPDCDALRALETPALVLDHAALERNISGMASAVRAADVSLRPHAKTHKCPEVAKLQLRAGAVGIACATVAEAEAMAAAGIAGLLLTTPIMGTDKMSRIARLNRSADIAVLVDHIRQIECLRDALRPGDRPLQVLIDIDVGQGRTGVTHVADVVRLAEAIAASPQLAFAGIQGYAGHAQHIVEPAARRAAAAQAAGMVRAVTDVLAAAGRPPGVISGSGTGTYRQDSRGPYNELQAGSYVFMDADYARIVDETGAGPGFSPSLFVLATVVSANRARQITVDAGTKALATNGPPPCHIIGAGVGASYRFGGDEHGIIDLAPGQSQPPLGARILVGATHCDPTVNLHAAYRVVKADGTAMRWPISGRYGA
ncbi:MAG: alanine racemase [Hyphomicrobiales bacterium]|nr:alanine racemase [Hyphomicrobiales bacterium]